MHTSNIIHTDQTVFRYLELDLSLHNVGPFKKENYKKNVRDKALEGFVQMWGSEA